ncbi:hypothetical protein BDBG_16515, partial [Blastomyces gilchristii SLH14081]
RKHILKQLNLLSLNLLSLNLLSQNLLKILRKLRRILLILLVIEEWRKKCKKRKIFKSPEIEDLSQ